MSHEDKGPEIVVAVSVLTAISTVFVVARVYTKAILENRLRSDDYLIVVSLICGWLAAGFCFAGVRAGIGKHIDTLTSQQKSSCILWTMAGFGPGIMSFALPKLATVAMLTHILNTGRCHKTFLWMMASICVTALMVCVANLFGQCSPAKSTWDFSIADNSCWNPWIIIHFAMFAGGFSAACDLYLAIYPACVLYRLKINTKQKIFLSIALGLGSVATAGAIYKTIRLTTLASHDFSYLFVWTAIEGNTILIATCIPVLRPLADRVLGRDFLGENSRDRSKYRNSRSKRSGKLPSSIELAASRRKLYGAPSSVSNNSSCYHSSHDQVSVCDKMDSQDNILPLQGSAITYPEMETGILRTQSVTITYSRY